MEITHRTNNLRIAPRKLRLVADKVRYQKVQGVLATLPFVVNKGAGLIHKSLRSAVEVAKSHDLDPETLVIQRVWCDEGRKLKRSVSKSHGRVTMIMKHSSHLSIVLSGEEKRKVSKRTKSESGEEQ